MFNGTGLRSVCRRLVVGLVVCGLAWSGAAGDIDLASLAASAGHRVDGAAAGDDCGYSVSTAGDVNGDGYADLIVGARYADNNGRADSGSAYVLFGKASGFANIDLASLGASDGYRIDGAAAGD